MDGITAVIKKKTIFNLFFCDMAVLKQLFTV